MRPFSCSERYEEKQKCVLNKIVDSSTSYTIVSAFSVAQHGTHPMANNKNIKKNTTKRKK